MTTDAGTRATAPGAPTSNWKPEKPPTPAKASRCSASIWTIGYDSVPPAPCSVASGGCNPTSTSCSGDWTGSQRSISASITLKIAVLAPMPSASVTTTTLANAGVLRSSRNA